MGAETESSGQTDGEVCRQQQDKANSKHLLWRVERCHQRTAEAFAQLVQYTQKRWDTVKVLADHGYEGQSKQLAASVQLLQDRCDANTALLAKYAPRDAAAAVQHSQSCSQDDLLQRSAVSDQMETKACPTGQHMQGSQSSRSATGAGSNMHSQRLPAPPPPPPPLPPGLKVVQTSGAATGQLAAAAAAGSGPRLAPPCPGPPPPHIWASASGPRGTPAGGAVDNSSSSSSRSTWGAADASGTQPRPAPPPPPLPSGPLLPKDLSNQQRGGACTNSSSNAASTQCQPGQRPPPPPPPLPPGKLNGLNGPHGSSSSSNRTPGSCAGAQGQPGARAPPPPPPLPPPVFNFKTPARPSTAPGATGRDSSSPSNSPQGINAIAAAAAAAGARRAAQEASEPSTPKGALLHQHSFTSMVSPRSAEGFGLFGSSSTCSKLKRLHVDPVPKQRLSEGSFWRQAGDVVQPFQAEFEYALRSMFSHTPISSRRAGDSCGHNGDAAAVEEAGGRVIKVIPDKRALQVEVCIKRLRMEATELAAALNRIDTHKLKLDDLPQIRSMLPKPDELTAVQAAKKKAMKEYQAKLAASAGSGGSSRPARPPRVCASSGSHESPEGSSGGGEAGMVPPRLGVVEAAFEALGGVKMLMAKMRACEFRYDVETVAALVDDFVADLSTSLAAFRACGQLQYLLAFVRDVANTMNMSAVQGGAAVEGLKLESLARLQSMRMGGATDLNLLHYIVAHLSYLMPGVLELDAEREAFKAVTKRGTFDTVLTRVRGLQDMHKRITADLAKAKEHLKHHPLQHGGNSSSPTSAASSAAAAGTTAGADTSSAASSSPSTAAEGQADAEQHMYIERLTELLHSSGAMIEVMQQKMDRVIQHFKWTAEYFCEDGNAGWKQQPTAFITHFHDLLEAIEATKKDTARVAKVDKILTQFVQEQRQLQEEAEAAYAAALAAAAVEEGCEEPTGWDEIEQQQPRQVHGGLEEEGTDDQFEEFADGESLRLTRTTSWVIGVVRNLDFGSSSEAGSCAGDAHAGSSDEARHSWDAVEQNGAQHQQDSLLQQSPATPASASALGAMQEAAEVSSSASSRQEQTHVLFQQELALPATHWQPDMLAGIWGSSMTVAGSERASNSMSTHSSTYEPT